MNSRLPAIQLHPLLYLCLGRKVETLLTEAIRSHPQELQA
jgi:hypothetical protein